MATLELVPLRSKFPYAGHMTLETTTTTPQVAGASAAGETAVRKGVQAR